MVAIVIYLHMIKEELDGCRIQGHTSVAINLVVNQVFRQISTGMLNVTLPLAVYMLAAIACL